MYVWVFKLGQFVLKENKKWIFGDNCFHIIIISGPSQLNLTPIYNVDIKA